MFVFTVCVYGKPRDNFSSGLLVFFSPWPYFQVCEPWPLQFIYFLLFPHTTMYTMYDGFHTSLLDLHFIKNTLISQVVFYLNVSVGDQYCM